jgi:dihydrodipicolinate synthase/N-acetylneuraminate lyase
VEGSVQFFHALGIDYERKVAYCATTSKNKRMKIVTLAKVRYGLSNDLSKAERMELLQKARDFVRKKPVVLGMGQKKIKKEFARAA